MQRFAGTGKSFSATNFQMGLITKKKFVGS